MGDSDEVLERVGRYEILMPIAKGGMATVYLARSEGHGGFDRYVALKLTLPHLRDDPEFAAHLLDEAKLVAHIRHTNVVPVLDVGQDERGVFLVMDYVAGDSLAGLYKLGAAQEAPLPARVGLRVLVDALEGLHAAHEHGDEDGYPLHLVHRDFSPQNILVGTDGVGRLTDFGIAKAASRIGNTAAGLIKGKMSYVSPEQARGAPLDRRCDLWAAGIIAWEIMCGRKLVAPNDKRSLLSTVKTEPRRIRTIVPDAPEAIDALVASVLKLDRDERPATAQLFGRDLASAARAAGMLAESHEVAEHVKRLAGPMLAERKARLATARRRRIGSVPDDSGSAPDGIATVLGLPSPIAGGGMAAPGKAHDDELSIAVDEGSERPPPAPDAVVAEPAAADSPAEEVAIPGVASHGPKIAMVLGGAGLVIAIAIVVVTLKLAAGRDTEASASPLASASASASASAMRASARVVAPLATAAATTAATATATAVEPEVPLAQFLALKTNAWVAEVRIGSRVIDTVIPAPNVNIELEPEETKGALKITAKSTDGRIATAELKQGELEATLSFPPHDGRPAPAPQKPAAPRGTGRPGAPRRL